MKVSRVEVLVEEPSMEVVLMQLLPVMLGSIPYQIRIFSGKQELLKQLPSRLRGYKSWLPDDARIVVVVDRDSDDCVELKNRLELIAKESGLTSKSRAAGGIFQVINRIVIEELEAFFFGDWEAVRQAYPKVPQNIPQKASYRKPDQILGGTSEALGRILSSAGYHKSVFRKIEAARAIAPYMIPEKNQSPSFRLLYQTFLAMRGLDP